MKKELWIVESDGVRRRAKKAKCRNCKTLFLRRIRGKSRFCSSNCSGEYNTKTNTTTVTCTNCGKPTQKRVSDLKKSKHQVYFCSRLCKEHSQSLSGNCPKIRPSHYGTGQDYSRFFEQHCDQGCQCGEKRIYLLQVHHIDGDRDNNIETNLEIVCGNCHIKRHLIQIDGKWRYWTKSLTPRNMLEQL